MYFDEATILGAEQHLPDGLFKGLTSLASFSCEKCGLQKLPNMDDLTALKQFTAFANQVGGATVQGLYSVPFCAVGGTSTLQA